MTQALKGRIALVVGGTSGIGRATAVALADAGAQVVVAGRNAAAGAVIADASGGRIAYEPVDVTDSASVARLVAAVERRHGRLDCAFNNAGWEGPAVATADTEEADWLRMQDTKLNGVWRCMKAELPLIVRGGGGAIVNMAGNWGLVGAAMFSSYCAAAHGIMGLTRAAAKEYAAAGVRINAVCPGAVDAPMLDRMVGGDAAVKDGFGAQLGIGRICTPGEVAAAVVWLCSEGASYVNGHGLVLDGGG